MNKKPILSQVHTACRYCVFAEYEDNTQTGCKLNKLDDYRAAGIDIVEVYDEGANFNIIDGRICLFYRNESSLESYARDTWEEMTIMQTKIPYHVILFVEEGDSLFVIKTALRKLKEQAIKPNMVTIVNKQYMPYVKDNDKYLKPSIILEALSTSGFHKYSIKNIFDTDLDDRSLIDLVFDSSKNLPYPFYIVFRADFDIPSNFSKEFNDAITISMYQVGFASPIDDLNGMIVNRTAHKKHSGNSFLINLEDKIRKYEDNAEHFIYKAEEVCPSFKL